MWITTHFAPSLCLLGVYVADVVADVLMVVR